MARPQIGNLIPLFSNDEYQRPLDWLPLPEVLEGGQKVVGLFAVFPHYSNFVAIKVSGAYTIDWGDGVIENYASSVIGYHKYDYNSINHNTECSRGYRQVIITITPQLGQNFTSIDLSEKHNQIGLFSNSTGWLDLKVVGSEISTFGLGNMYANFAKARFLESFNFIGTNKISRFTDMFNDCNSLQSLILNTSSGTDFSNMFYSCYNLQSIPKLNISKGTNFSNMFNSCSALRLLPQLDISSGTNFNNMFYGCRRLQSVPQLNTIGGTNFTNMFSNCSSLQLVPQLDFHNGTNFSNLFYSCYSLSKVSVAGIGLSISFNNCCLSREALVEIFNNLATAAGQTITISGNWGAGLLTQEDRDIAINKGWTIVG